jgi:hypothetical protein
LRAGHTNHRAGDPRAAAAVGYAAVDISKSRCWSIEANSKDRARAAREVIETAVGGNDQIDWVGNSGCERDGCGRCRIKAANPTSTKLRIEILADVVAREVNRGWIVEGSAGYRAAGGGGASMSVLKQRIAKVGIRRRTIPFTNIPTIV